MYRRRKTKGQTVMDLFIIALVLFLCLFILTLLDFVSLRHMIIGKQTIYTSMEIDDRGSEIVSLLGATSSGMTHMEILGDSLASNHDAYTEQGLEGLKSATDNLGSGFFLSIPGTSIGTSLKVTESYGAQLPVPGAQKGNLKKSLELVKT